MGQKIGDRPSDFEALPEAEQASPKSTCADTKRNLKALRESGQKRAVCFEWQTPQEMARTQGSSSASVVWCGGQPENQVYVARDSICSRRGVVIVMVDTVTGVVLGNAYGTLEQEIDTQNTNPEFFEYIRFDLTKADLTSSVMTVKVDSICSLNASCRQNADPWNAPRPITVGGSIDGGITRLWTEDQGNKSFLISYALTVNIGGTYGSTRWGDAGQPSAGDYTVRCDKEINGSTKGCVVPAFTPTFVVDREKYNQARQFIGMVQASMATHPGWEGHGQPLHRESVQSEVDKNRAVVCDSTFKPHANTPPPVQCDEFPFARTKESGRRLGVTSGASCQQYNVISETLEGKEYLSLTWPGSNQGKMPPAGAKCARASMPKNQNEGVGGDLGRKTNEWRLLEGDAYWVDAGQPVN
ncbi:hypothetical protein OHB35_52650 [Streptomyces phaeochromogenes]|uniref:Uncharacterized protein n=1 Tax=Streptomyces phaeochromogenes TaxID=1923 RepID=A0ABZ1HUJ1_STRPH|nr:hypothetical protein [Streptomyces phaeochromogenes]WSD21201.1 hypothetical protein OHB35_52650 [Streptomyces phaeochromogenes]